MLINVKMFNALKLVWARVIINALVVTLAFFY